MAGRYMRPKPRPTRPPTLTCTTRMFCSVGPDSMYSPAISSPEKPLKISPSIVRTDEVRYLQMQRRRQALWWLGDQAATRKQLPGAHCNDRSLVKMMFSEKIVENQQKVVEIPSQCEEGHYAAGKNCFSATHPKVVGKWRQQKSKTVPESILKMLYLQFTNQTDCLFVWNRI